MDCLIIGGTGTISEGIAFEALKRKYNVTLLNRGTQNHRLPSGAHVINGDLNNVEEIEKILQGMHFDVIVDPITYNVEQLANRCKLFDQHCNTYVFISSCAAIGSGEGMQDENSTKTPIWKYGTDKLECERFLQNNNFSFHYTIIRPSITYGDIRIPIPVACRTNPWTVINRIEQNKPLVCFDFLGSNKTTHNLMNIRDFSSYVVELFDRTVSYNNDYIVCSEQLYSWDYVYKVLYKVLDKEEHVYLVDREVFKVLNRNLYDDILYDKDSSGVNYSNKKVKKDTGTNIVETSLQDGIASIVEYLKNNYSDREIEEEYEIMTDIILLHAIKDKDEFLKNYLKSLNKRYKRKLRFIWMKRKAKYMLRMALGK